jgi:hypothetical protein
VLDSTVSGAFNVNTLSVYDGRVAGVGRIVTGSTFHHYLDINLVGASSVDTSTLNDFVGGDAEKGQGLSTNAAAFADIQAVYINITNWLARPKPAISLILERSTFSQDEVTATPSFPAAIFVTVNGLTPSRFPNGGITTLSPSAASLMQWAPAVNVGGGFPITVTPTGVESDDPNLSDRLQLFTFLYQVNFTGNAFGFGGNAATVPVNASLTASAAPTALTDMAWIELVKSANPFLLDLADGNSTSWLSSDVKVFHVVAGQLSGRAPARQRDPFRCADIPAQRRVDHQLEPVHPAAIDRGRIGAQRGGGDHEQSAEACLQFRAGPRPAEQRRRRCQSGAGLLQDVYLSNHRRADVPA